MMSKTRERRDDLWSREWYDRTQSRGSPDNCKSACRRCCLQHLCATSPGADPVLPGLLPSTCSSPWCQRISAYPLDRCYRHHSSAAGAMMKLNLNSSLVNWEERKKWEGSFWNLLERPRTLRGLSVCIIVRSHTSFFFLFFLYFIFLVQACIVGGRGRGRGLLKQFYLINTIRYWYLLFLRLIISKNTLLMFCFLFFVFFFTQPPSLSLSLKA